MGTKHPNTPGDPSNPFATRFTRPGGLPFEFPPGFSAPLLLERLEVAGGRGQIVGPHGSGKSALVAALVLALEEAGRRVALFTLREGQRRWPISGQAARQLDPKWVVVVDGYEQLGRLARWRARLVCRARGCGLVVTAHNPVGLPTLYTTAPSLETAQRIVDRLMAGHAPTIGREDVARAFDRAGGNLREMLFDLYDVFEARLGARHQPG